MTEANLDASNDDKKTTQNSCKAKDGINLGLYDCLDNASDKFELNGGTLDDDGNILETETASHPPDRSGAGADARFASQDAHCQPQDPVPVSDGRNNNATMGSSGFGGRSSDDSSSDSSSCRPVTVLVAVCRHVGIAAASSAALRVTQTLPGITLVTGTSCLTASLSVRSSLHVT
jgi:hypothetical protein